jgi:hypothetical protein
MIPDWKDPWLEGIENSDQGPDDDQNNDEEDMDNRHVDRDDEGEKDNAPLKSNSGGNRRNDDRIGAQQADDTRDAEEPSCHHGSKQGSLGRKRCSDYQGSNQQNTMAAGSMFSKKVCHCSEKPSGSQRMDEAFRSVRKLGYGAFGIVEEVIHSRSSAHFVRKTIQTNYQDLSIALAKVRKEVTALRQLTHEHIIKMLASYRTQT